MKDVIDSKIKAIVERAAKEHAEKYGKDSIMAYTAGGMQGWVRNLCNYMTETQLNELNTNLDSILAK